MPMHDWSRVSAGTYHNFHVLWLSAITNHLNAGILPEGCFAMAEQVIGGPEPDVVTLNLGMLPPGQSIGVVALAAPRQKPTTSVVMIADEDRYVRKANRIVVRHELGEVLAVIELVSPGNKNSVHGIRALVDKLAGLLFDRINLLVIDPLPPTLRDPQGIHALIWNEITDQPFHLPPDRRLTIAAYQSEPVKTAWVEPLAVGMPLPSMPLFLRGEFYVNLPLEPGYMETWNVLPQQLKRLVAPPSSSGA
jgi:hypothetical protein